MTALFLSSQGEKVLRRHILVFDTQRALSVSLTSFLGSYNKEVR